LISIMVVRNEQPSKSGLPNHSANTSNIASNCSRGVWPRRMLSVFSQSRVQSSSRRRRNSIISSSFEGKFLYSVIFAVPALAMTASTPTARTPSRLNSS